MVHRLGKGDGAGKRLVGWICTLAHQKYDHISIYNEIGSNLGSSRNFQICLKIGFWSKNCNFFTFFLKNASLPPRNDRSYHLKMTIQWLSKLVIFMNSMNNRRNMCYLHNHIHQHWKFAWLAVMFDYLDKRWSHNPWTPCWPLGGLCSGPCFHSWNVICNNCFLTQYNDDQWYVF